MPNLVSQFMDQDHKKLDLNWKRFGEHLEDESARGYFDTFYIHIERHIRIENDILFRALEKHLGMSENMGPTVRLRKDHEMILDLLGKTLTAFNEGNFGRVNYFYEHLRSALDSHREREMSVPYLLLDKIISVEEWIETVKKFALEELPTT